MKILVSDTSVLIDLERGGLLEATFSLPFEFAVPDLLFEQELSDFNGEQLLQLGLRVEELGETEVRQAGTYWRRESGLSLPDTFALALARHREWMLLTGDGELRALARREEVECHGVLWILDQILDESVIDVSILHVGLKRISEHPRCRLPKREMRIRLERYTDIISNQV